MTKVFVSGCFDVLHAGHMRFLRDARRLGDELIVCIASDAVLRLVKGREPSQPVGSRLAVMRSISFVTRAWQGSSLNAVFDFEPEFRSECPNILAITEDDPNREAKENLCAGTGCRVVVIEKASSGFRVSTTSIRQNIRQQSKVPLRVDFAGGWLDVPKFARPGAYIVNCAIEPLVSLDDWPYEIGGGLGGSAAKAILEQRDGVATELASGVGWQDPAVINETGLCVWRSGPTPILEAKYNPDWLRGKMLLYWTGKPHVCAEHVNLDRPWVLIEKAGMSASNACRAQDLGDLCDSIKLSHQSQLSESMLPLADINYSPAKKYLGAGWGGYALYVYTCQSDRDLAHSMLPTETKIIEPYLR